MEKLYNNVMNIIHLCSTTDTIDTIDTIDFTVDSIIFDYILFFLKISRSVLFTDVKESADL